MQARAIEQKPGDDNDNSKTRRNYVTSREDYTEDGGSQKERYSGMYSAKVERRWRQMYGSMMLVARLTASLSARLRRG